MRRALTAVTLLVLAVGCSGGGSEPTVSFASPEDGATVSSPVPVEMSAESLEIAEAGEVVEGEGHFHVMVDTECVETGETIPEDEQHLHFGDASTSTELDLEPGEHNLCLQAGDGSHAALGATDEISVTVE